MTTDPLSREELAGMRERFVHPSWIRGEETRKQALRLLDAYEELAARFQDAEHFGVDEQALHELQKQVAEQNRERAQRAEALAERLAAVVESLLLWEPKDWNRWVLPLAKEALRDYEQAREERAG